MVVDPVRQLGTSCPQVNSSIAQIEHEKGNLLKDCLFCFLLLIKEIIQVSLVDALLNKPPASLQAILHLLLVDDLKTSFECLF